jgi:phage/plasmid-associated DNA primase
MAEGGPLSSSWFSRVDVCPEQALDAVSAEKTANPVSVAIGMSPEADVFLLRHILSKESSPGSALPNRVFGDARAFVEQVLAADPRVVGMGKIFARHPASKYVVVSVRAVDLCAHLKEEEQRQLGALLLERQGEMTIRQIVEQFPAFGECYELAMKLVTLAKAQGRRACCVSNGWTGFRVLLLDTDSSLYVCTTRKGEGGGGAATVESLLKTALGFGDQLPSCVDLGEHKSSTLLHPHLSTGLWSKCIHHDDLDQQYGSHQLDPDAHGILRECWASCLDGIPSSFAGIDLLAISPAPMSATADAGAAGVGASGAPRLSGRIKEKKRTEEKKRTGQESKKRGPGRPSKKQQQASSEDIDDTFEDVGKMLATLELALDQSSVGKSHAGKTILTVRVRATTAANAFKCRHPNHQGPSSCESFECRVHRDTGQVVYMCPECRGKDEEFEWPTRCAPGTLSADPLFHVVSKQTPLKNHAEIACVIAAEVKEQLAFDPGSLKTVKWRLYDVKTGTWKACASLSEPKMTIHKILSARLKSLENIASCLEQGLPEESAVRLDTAAKAARLRKQLEDAGGFTFLGHLCSLLEHLATVDQAMWMSRFAGHLPMSNVLLQFCTRTGQVTAHEYRPDQYIRHEYQATFVKWDPNAPVHRGMEELLNSWWGEGEEKRAWLQFLVYGLSRTAFAEKLFILFGPAGTAKSTVIAVMAYWFGDANVFMQANSAFLIQKGNTSAARDDDGTGHNSTALSFCDKALVGFPEVPQNGVIRDDVVKRITGDKQGGRHAHSAEVLNFRRLFLAFLMCNSLPRPFSVQELDALIGRIELVVSTKVFYRNEAHKDELLGRMTAEERASCTMTQADSTVVDRIKADPAAATHFLNLLAASWTMLIVNQNRTFVPSPRAKAIMTDYWQSLRLGADSVVSFLGSQVEYVKDGVLPKVNLWLAYNAWYKEHSKVHGSPGPLVASDNGFYKQVSTYFQHHHAVTTGQRKAMVMMQSELGKLVLKPKKKPHSYIGVVLKPHKSYPTPPPPGPTSSCANEGTE